MVKALQLMKGIKQLTATVIASELGDINRFENPCELMSFLGLTTSEHTTEERVDARVRSRRRATVFTEVQLT